MTIHESIVYFPEKIIALQAVFQDNKNSKGVHIIRRILDLENLLEKSSYFLFGARGTGKSWLAGKISTEKADYIDLLHSKTFITLQTNPSRLEEMISKKWIIIDEIQRLPELLNEVHRLIESRRLTFLLIGSSARKLKRKRVNLLPGKAFVSKLFPLTWRELEKTGKFDLEKYLHTGGLPQAALGKRPGEFLYSYVDTYLKEEIQMESLVRNLANYHRFLISAAFMNTEMLNFTKIASDAHLKPNTVRDYYQILQDTLVGDILPSWNKSTKRKAIQTGKFYFFDLGVIHALRDTRYLNPQSDLYEKTFEHFIYMELVACLSYFGMRESLSYWRSKSGLEVDFIIGDETAIEVKSTNNVSKRDIKGLKAISEEKEWKHKLIVSHDKQKKFEGNIQSIPWQMFLEKLWNGDYRPS